MTDAPDLDATARRVIDGNQFRTLGTLDADGRPRLSPVNYTAARYSDFYWVSSPLAHHSRNLGERADIQIVIFDPVAGGDAVYFAATAREDELAPVCPEAFRATGATRRMEPAELRGPASTWPT